MKYRTVPYPDNPVIRIDVNAIPEEIKLDLARATYEAVLRSLRNPKERAIIEARKKLDAEKLQEGR